MNFHERCETGIEWLGRSRVATKFLSRKNLALLSLKIMVALDDRLRSPSAVRLPRKKENTASPKTPERLRLRPSWPSRSEAVNFC